MSINLRRIGVNTFVTETSRRQGKVVQRHVGSYTNPFVRFIYRKSQLTKTLARGLRNETAAIRQECRLIEQTMLQLESLAKHFFVFLRLAVTRFQEPSPMSKPDSPGQATQHAATKPDREHIDEALRVLPAKHAFGKLCRQADAGDPEAIRRLDELIEQAPEILESMADLIRFAKQAVLRGISRESVVFSKAMTAKLQVLEDRIKADHVEDPILDMMAEIVAISHLDAMRCALLALNGHESKTDADHIQRLVDRSVRRFVGIQQNYQRLAWQSKSRRAVARSRKTK
ncbi:hypothetical protein Mal15_19520 [Stieleria maiorica]|uniref:Uncharacterized protein n=1 Tax=Stieleria maiorica TaxID=2795974 RepID=A0A5B9MCG0_9BACT|nr:hypothetical protein [Stieleria maiorica]QEF97906.1 hypothetical protein Mal15_19520 [Stieleria maiorica]